MRFCEKDTKSLKNHHLRFVLCSYGEDFAKFCDLLKMYELYCNQCYRNRFSQLSIVDVKIPDQTRQQLKGEVKWIDEKLFHVHIPKSVTFAYCKKLQLSLGLTMYKSTYTCFYRLEYNRPWNLLLKSWILKVFIM